jgi:transposase-like protein
MPIDPTGTTPGLAVSQTEEPKKVSMKCKRPGCDSTQAIEVMHPGSASGRRMYRCVKCKQTWGVSTGGPIDL